MSGTSLDGLDLCYCRFWLEGEKWNFETGPATTIPYNETWKVRLSKLHEQPMHIYPKTDRYYGTLIGQEIRKFLDEHELQADLIASHGHTIFHQPDQGYTAQIGNGAAIYAETGIPVVCDFRTVDVALGGQGAPLVPMGDELLFGDYRACLNLGGFANISYDNKQVRQAFDICPCNILLNAVARQCGLAFDEEGRLAAMGKVMDKLLENWNLLPYYQKAGTKSLGREWVEDVFWPAAHLSGNEKPEDLLATLTEHMAVQIARVLTEIGTSDVLVTGGGTYNLYLLQRIRAHTTARLMVPNDHIVQFKEAIIFAFLGCLRYFNRINTGHAYTGAQIDSIGGALFGPTNR